VETSGIIRANGIFVNIIPKIGSIELLQRFIQVLAAVYIYAILLDYHTGKALAKLDIHIFQKRAFG
jgi:hypothetical protein